MPPTGEDRRRGYVVFQRDLMQEVYYNDLPAEGEVGRPLSGEAFAGEYEPLTVSLAPLRDLGKVTVTAGDLSGPAGTIPAAAIDVGYVSYRITRVTMEGSVYTIAPRFVMPSPAVEIPKDITRRFWLTVKTPLRAKPGMYRGTLTIRPEKGAAAAVPVAFRVRAGTLDPVDIPVGPYSYTINLPWYDDDPQTARYNRQTTLASLRKMREYGFTSCSGFPHIYYRGFKDGRPVLDFTAADAEMKLAKELGFLAVNTYGGGVSGIDAYHVDTGAMNTAGFKDYSAFIRAVYGAVQKHADAEGWLPVYYNLGDEPMGDESAALGRECRGLSPRLPQGAALLHGRQQFRRQQPPGPALPAGQGPARGQLGRARRGGGEVAPRRRQRLGLLQRRRPLDLRRIHVQGRQAIRHEVPHLLALERLGGRSLLRPGLPRRRLFLVQRNPGRSS